MNSRPEIFLSGRANKTRLLLDKFSLYVKFFSCLEPWDVFESALNKIWIFVENFKFWLSYLSGYVSSLVKDVLTTSSLFSIQFFWNKHIDLYSGRYLDILIRFTIKIKSRVFTIFQNCLLFSLIHPNFGIKFHLSISR